MRIEVFRQLLHLLQRNPQLLHPQNKLEPQYIFAVIHAGAASLAFGRPHQADLFVITNGPRGNPQRLRQFADLDRLIHFSGHIKVTFT